MTPQKQPADDREPLAYTMARLSLTTGVSIDKLQQCVRRGELVPSYVGTKPIVTREEALRWLRSLPAEPVRNHR